MTHALFVSFVLNALAPCFLPAISVCRFMLQTRNGKRTAKASVKIAVDMVKEGLLTEQEGLLQINAERMDFFLFPSIDPKSPKNVIALLLSSVFLLSHIISHFVLY